MSKKNKRPAPRRQAAKTKKRKTPAKKSGTNVTKRGRSKAIARTLPDPTASSFVVFDPVDCAFLVRADSDVAFTNAAPAAALFASKDEAQGVVDDALMLADGGSPIHRAEVRPAKDFLKPAYRFELVEGEYLLSAVPVARDDDSALTFAKARASTLAALKAGVRDASLALAKFAKMWG